MDTDIYQRTVNEAWYYLSILDFAVGVIRIRFDLAATWKLINRRKFVDKLSLRPHETQSGRREVSFLQFADCEGVLALWSRYTRKLDTEVIWRKFEYYLIIAKYSIAKEVPPIPILVIA